MGWVRHSKGFFAALKMTRERLLKRDGAGMAARFLPSVETGISRRVCPFCSPHIAQSFRTQHSEVRNLIMLDNE